MQYNNASVKFVLLYTCFTGRKRIWQKEIKDNDLLQEILKCNKKSD